jgi:hypothetical protein
VEHPASFAYVGEVGTFLTILVVLLMVGTPGVLFAGLIGLVRGSLPLATGSHQR